MAMKKTIFLLVVCIALLVGGCNKAATPEEKKPVVSGNDGLITVFLPPESVGENVFFKKEQSYELADLIKVLSPDKGSEAGAFLHTLKKKDFWIYWDNKAGAENFPYSQSGGFGLLIADTGQTNYWQEWDNGLLVNKKAVVGLPSAISVYGDLYWRPLFVRIYTDAPATLSRLLVASNIKSTIASDELLNDYFEQKGIKAELVKADKRGMSYGETLYRIYSDNKEDIWLSVMTSQGNRTGNTSISIYYTYEDAVKYASIK